MRVTRKVYALYKALRDRGWMSAPDLADAVGEPRQNLDHSLKAMIEAGIVERRTTVRPMHYRLVETIPPAAQRALADAAEIHEDAR